MCVCMREHYFNIAYFVLVQTAWRTGTCLVGYFLSTHWVEGRTAWVPCLKSYVWSAVSKLGENPMCRPPSCTIKKVKSCFYKVTKLFLYQIYVFGRFLLVPRTREGQVYPPLMIVTYSDVPITDINTQTVSVSWLHGHTHTHTCLFIVVRTLISAMLNA